MCWQEWILTFGGAGRAPKAPGTAGSLAAAVVVAGMVYFFPSQIPLWSWNLILALCVLAASYGMIALGSWATAHYGRKDPQDVVLDEVAGVFLTMLFLPIHPDGRGWWAVVAAFAAFRLFDVVKPPPCRRLEELPHGWGVLADDLMAGIYANVLCQIILRLAFREYTI